MKKTFILLITVFGQFLCFGQQIGFSDSSFQRAILNYDPPIDQNGDGLIQLNEASEVRVLDLMEKGLSSIEDIRFFPNIKELFVTKNNLTEVRLTDLDSLEKFYVAKNHLESLDLKNLKSLKVLACGVNSLKTVSLENLPQLESLNCMNNQLGELDVSKFPQLKYLSADNNKLQSIDVSQNTELIQIVLSGNELKSIDIRQNLKLKVNIMYIDKDVEIIGTPEQMKSSRGASITIEE